MMNPWTEADTRKRIPIEVAIRRDADEVIRVWNDIGYDLDDEGTFDAQPWSDAWGGYLGYLFDRIGGEKRSDDYRDRDFHVAWIKNSETGEYLYKDPFSSLAVAA